MLYSNMYDTGRGELVTRTSNGEHYLVINGLYYYSASDYASKLYNRTKENYATKLQTYKNYLANKV